MVNEPIKRCGFMVYIPRIPFGIGFIDIGSHCCSRPTWREYERCIWHADVRGKPTDVIENKLKKERGFIISPILRGLSCKNLSAPNSLLINADFSDSSLVSANFSNSFILSSLFKNCDLRYSSFRNTRLHLSEFFDVDMRVTDVSMAEFYRCKHINSDMQRSDITSATLGTAKFYNCRLDELVGYNVDFSAALLKDCSLTECLLFDSNFQYIVAHETEFTRTTLENCDFTLESLFKNSSFWEADLQRSDFTSATFDEVDARGAWFTEANLEDVTFSSSDLRRARLVDAKIYQIQLNNVQINDRTNFGKETVYSKDETAVPLENIYPFTEDLAIDRSKAAAWSYHKIKHLCQDNALSEKSSEYHIKWKEAERRFKKEEGDKIAYIMYTINRYSSYHGEDIIQVLKVSTFVIVISGFLYPALGGVQYSNQSFSRRSLLDYSLSISELSFATEWISQIPVLFKTISLGIYLSIVSFTTIGSAKYSAASIGGQILVGIESLLGTLLMALLIFVLGRKATE